MPNTGGPSLNDCMDGTSHNTTAFNRWNDDERDVNVNRNVVCLNRNDAKRNLNLDNWTNDWNDNWGFLGAQQSRFLPSLFAGEFLYCLTPPTTDGNHVYSVHLYRSRLLFSSARSSG